MIMRELLNERYRGMNQFSLPGHSVTMKKGEIQNPLQIQTEN